MGSPSAEDLAADRARRHIAERILTQLVELAATINAHLGSALAGRAPLDYRNSFALAAETGAITPELAESLSGSAGLRNVLVHAYLDIDLEQVAAALPLARRLYRDYAAAVAAFVLAQRTSEEPGDA